MGDHDRGPPREKAVDGDLEPRLGGRVESCRGLVEEDDSGVAEQGAGEGEKLGFTGRQRAWIEVSVEAFGLRVQPRTKTDLDQRCGQPRVVNVSKEADVLPQRRRE